MDVSVANTDFQYHTCIVFVLCALSPCMTLLCLMHGSGVM
jgi:hypothetical protein